MNEIKFGPQFSQKIKIINSVYLSLVQLNKNMKESFVTICPTFLISIPLSQIV
jgi:hypothetical protein